MKAQMNSLVTYLGISYVKDIVLKVGSERKKKLRRTVSFSWKPPVKRSWFENMYYYSTGDPKYVINSGAEAKYFRYVRDILNLKI